MGFGSLAVVGSGPPTRLARHRTLTKKDTALDPLRQREDFQKLVAELEGKGE
jgi:hypothetical protein